MKMWSALSRHLRLATAVLVFLDGACDPIWEPNDGYRVIDLTHTLCGQNMARIVASASEGTPIDDHLARRWLLATCRMLWCQGYLERHRVDLSDAYDCPDGSWGYVYRASESGRVAAHRAGERVRVPDSVNNTYAAQIASANAWANLRHK